MNDITRNYFELNNNTEKEYVIEAFLKLVDMHYTISNEYVGLRGNSQISIRFTSTGVWISALNAELLNFYCNYVIETSKNIFMFK